jgi:catechol 2,3-dioxygenase-like lactoylglutathione lyase family enzyme
MAAVMPLGALDHVNLRTTHLEEMCAFYCELLGLVRGPRPAFAFAGAWLYCNGRPCVHLVEVPVAATRGGEPSLSHFAFTATGLAELLARLRGGGVAYTIAALPGTNVKQVVFTDPEGNALHVDFAGESEGDLG